MKIYLNQKYFFPNFDCEAYLISFENFDFKVDKLYLHEEITEKIKLTENFFTENFEPLIVTSLNEKISNKERDNIEIDENEDKVMNTMNENIKNMFDIDTGYNMFYTLSKENLHLLSNTSVNKVLNYFSEKYKKTNDNEEGKCNNYIIAKKYFSEEDIEKDNNVQLFFDKEYDDTVYDILDVYSEERKKRDPAD